MSSNNLGSSLCNGVVLIFKFSLNMHEYANEIIFIQDHGMKVFVKLYH